MNTILIVAKNMIEAVEPESVQYLEQGHGYIITGDFGFIGSVATRKEAFDVANGVAEGNNAEVQIEE